MNKRQTKKPTLMTDLCIFFGFNILLNVLRKIRPLSEVETGMSVILTGCPKTKKIKRRSRAWEVLYPVGH